MVRELNSDFQKVKSTFLKVIACYKAVETLKSNLTRSELEQSYYGERRPLGYVEKHIYGFGQGLRENR